MRAKTRKLLVLILMSTLLTQIIPLTAYTADEIPAGSAETPACTVNYYMNNGTDALFASTGGIAPGGTVGTLPVLNPIYDGFVFRGWILPDGTEFSAATPILSDTSVYALWISAESALTCSVTYCMNIGPSGIYSKVTGILPGGCVGALPNPEPTFSGKLFAGWYFGDGVTPFTAATPVLSDINVYAHWTSATPGSTVSVTYYLNDGTSSVYAVKTGIAPGGTVGALPSPEPTRTGKQFALWYLGDGITPFTVSTPVNADLSVFAHWTDAATGPTATVTYYYNDGTNGVYTQQAGIPVGGTVKALPSAPLSSGRSFAGWVLSDGTTPFDEKTVISADTPVFARWSSTFYTVLFDSQGGTIIPLIAGIPYNGTTGPLPTPYLSGFYFGGWYTGLDGTGTLFTSSTPVFSTMVVYAKWLTVYSPYTPYLPSVAGTASVESYQSGEDDFEALPVTGDAAANPALAATLSAAMIALFVLYIRRVQNR